jgi:hypothetical protein
MCPKSMKYEIPPLSSIHFCPFLTRMAEISAGSRICVTGMIYSNFPPLAPPLFNPIPMATPAQQFARIGHQEGLGASPTSLDQYQN